MLTGSHGHHFVGVIFSTPASTRFSPAAGPMTVRDLGSEHEGSREQLPPFWKLFAPAWFRWTAMGFLCGICAGTAYYLIAILLPKALVDGFARDWPLRHSEPLIGYVSDHAGLVRKGRASRGLQQMWRRTGGWRPRSGWRSAPEDLNISVGH